MSHFFSGNHDMGGQFLYNYKEEEKVMVKQKLVWIPVFNWTAFYVFNIYVQCGLSMTSWVNRSILLELSRSMPDPRVWINSILRIWINSIRHCGPHCMYTAIPYRVSTGPEQEKTCFHYREPLFLLQGPCIHYREWVCSIWFKTVLYQGRH